MNVSHIGHAYVYANCDSPGTLLFCDHCGCPSVDGDRRWWRKRRGHVNGAHAMQALVGGPHGGGNLLRRWQHDASERLMTFAPSGYCKLAY